MHRPRRTALAAVATAVLLGGKRMRPLLVVASCDLFNVDRERAMRVALGPP